MGSGSGSSSGSKACKLFTIMIMDKNDIKLHIINSIADIIHVCHSQSLVSHRAYVLIDDTPKVSCWHMKLQ